MAGPCCVLEICCPPGSREQAEALLESVGVCCGSDEDSTGVAEAIVSGYQLVPKTLIVGPHADPSRSGDEAVAAGRKRLEALHAHVKAELLEILPALGHPVKA